MSNGTGDETAATTGPSRRQVIVGGATVVGIVTAALPSVAAAVSDAGATTTTAAPAGYSDTGAADPSLAAINAVPTVTTNGNVEVSGSDSF